MAKDNSMLLLGHNMATPAVCTGAVLNLQASNPICLFISFCLLPKFKIIM